MPDSSLTTEKQHLADSREGLRPDAREGRFTRRCRRQRGLDRVPRRQPVPPADVARRRPVDPAVLRPHRHRHSWDRSRTLLHRTPSRARRAGRSDGGRLARRHLPRLLPRQPRRPDGRAAAAPLRIRRRRTDGVRGRDVRDRPRHVRSCAGDQPDPDRGDRAAPRRPDARHRGHHPARSGRVGARRSRCDTICVQGGPGTGKTAVGLHRAAYLLYAHRAQLREPAGCSSSGPTPPSCTTSSRCCRRSARSR